MRMPKPDSGFQTRGRASSCTDTGWIWTCLIAAGIEDADAVVVATDGDNTNIVIAQVAQRRFDCPCVVTRVLDPARAAFYSSQGLRTVCATSAAIDSTMDAICATPGRGAAA